MSPDEQPSFTAVITIRLPAEEGEATLQVVLRPADALTMEDGTSRLLRDCTLGELRRYAAELEDSLGAEYDQITIGSLVTDHEAQLELADPAASDMDALLGHALVLAPEPAAEAVPAEPCGEASDDTDAQGAEAEAGTPEEQLSPEDAAEVEPGVTVAEAEPLVPEREAAEAGGTPGLAEARDVRILGRRRPLNHPTWTAADILINEPAFRDTQAHALTSLDREVAGVLLGPPPEKQPDGRYVVHVTDSLIARHTRMHGASVTYTPESWRDIHDRLAEHYPDGTAAIVGWYHTHPGFGVFLSNMDLFIHENFFTQIWHIALVLDPVAQRSGFFCWDRPKSRVDRYEFPWPSWAAGSW